MARNAVYRKMSGRATLPAARLGPPRGIIAAMTEPSFRVSTSPVGDLRADLLVVPVPSGSKKGASLPPGSPRDLVSPQAMARHGFTGASGQSLMLPGPDRTVLLVGLGPADAAGAGGAIRDAAMCAGLSARPFETVATILPAQGTDAAAAFAEGFLLGSYRFDGQKKQPEPNRTRTVTVRTEAADKSAIRKGLDRGTAIGSAMNWARDLTNMSPSTATPAYLADQARAMAKRFGLTSKVWNRAALERGGFGGILAVGSGSVHDPSMVELTYSGGRSGAKPIAVTGKGITFDSGGLNIKEREEMAWMRSDMAGAAAALATLRAVAALGVKANVVAAIPFAENIPGPASYRPGDVVTHRGGVTSEVLDTDAEGRVLLADALAYLCERKPAAILDSATLTDAAGMGAELWAGMGNDRAAVAEVLAAGTEAGDPGWEIPLWTPYRSLIESTVAEVKNIGSHDLDSSMLAGLFLETFVNPRVPWVHVDSGSTAWAEYDRDSWPEGATSSPARAFVRFIETRAGR
ncbi:MAG: leucyl aminopeptidase [Actinomycetota bacterium]|nr:leucyl aminopeptidase [Actinomycetota bacterium]